MEEVFSWYVSPRFEREPTDLLFMESGVLEQVSGYTKDHGRNNNMERK